MKLVQKLSQKKKFYVFYKSLLITFLCLLYQNLKTKYLKIKILSIISNFYCYSTAKMQTTCTYNFSTRQILFKLQTPKLLGY